MDAVKLREKAEKLLALAKEQEKKERDNQQKKVSSLVFDHVKANGYEFGPDFAAKVRAIMEPGAATKSK